MKSWAIVLFLVVFATPAFAETVSVSTLSDQSSVNLTVYNMGRGLVKDVRKLTVPVGQGELRFMDVASQIMPQTVHVKSLTETDKFRVLEQNYEYDLISRSKLLDKYVGQKIKLSAWNQDQDKQTLSEATLISNNDGGVYDINGEIYLGYPGYAVLPRLPENLIAKPTLTWLFDNEQALSQDVEVSYMTNGVTWSADYVLVVNKDDSAGDLAGWVTVDNQSGAMYQDAQLKLIAGKPNVVQAQSPGRNRVNKEMMMLADSAGGSQFQEESLFEYHLYDLQRKTTIKDKQTKQISLLESAGIPLNKTYVVNNNDSNYYWQENAATRKLPVKVGVSFKNSESDHLGMPIPAGIVRLYKQDKKGGQQFIGEDRVEHTPKDEQVKLKVGEAFDVVAEKKQVAFRRISNRTTETETEVTIRNHKDEDVVVNVEELFYGMSEWDVLRSSLEYKKKDAQTLTFDVPVSKNGEAVVAYTVQVTN
jgi:hypothetical protein